MAPIDPVQLLKALAPLLSANGGINGIDKAPQFASLMKKFSKKLVSRCVYCNVLKATSTDILAKFLEEGGWNTINMWLNDAKENSNQHFLVELVELCKVLPMTLERLKENNTPKLVKALTKYNNESIRTMSNELVTKWMTIIKGDNIPPVEVARKKRKPSKDNEKEQKDPKKVAKDKDSPVKEKDLPAKEKDLSAKEKDSKKIAKTNDVQKVEKRPVKVNNVQKSVKGAKEVSKLVEKEVPKRPVKLRNNKRVSSEKDVKAESGEEIISEPVPKKLRTERPKTVKSYQAKFRATGLEQEVPLPKKIPKKTSVIDKSVAAAAAKNAVVKRFNTSLNERITEKKIKPESLLNVNESSNASGGIKLIPAKPRPHILHESASFIDALVAAPTTAPKRKKKPVNKPASAPSTPPSPTMKPPKLQFYKETLELNTDEAEKESENKGDNKDSPASPSKEDAMDNSEKVDAVKDDKSDSSDATSFIADGSNSVETKVSPKEEPSDEEMDTSERDPNALRSILSLGRRKHKKKNVRWVGDEDLKQIFYFELDETERVNVLRARPFGDLKNIEAKQEREAFEAAKRQAGDKMEEATTWWIVPKYIDAPQPLTVAGLYSREKEIQHLRQQSILQEIYFTREMIPDTPHEPDVEVYSPHEPKLIPLDDENAMGSVMDYSNQDYPKPKALLPEVLTSLIKIPNARPPTQGLLGQLPMDQNNIPNMPPQQQPPQSAMSPTSPYDPGEPVAPSLLGVNPGASGPPMFNPQMPRRNEPENVGVPNWGPMESNNIASPTENFYNPGFPMNPNIRMDNRPPLMHPGGGSNNDGMRMRMGGPMMGRDMYRPNMSRGGPFPMNRPPGAIRDKRRTVPCRHFLAGGCRFGPTCSFLHPGVNGPPL